MENGWHLITNIKNFDTPLLAIYPDRIKENIELGLKMVNGDVSRFRPHIKTHKIGEIIKIFLSYGITKIKCATIAEAELAADFGVPDVLLAYQPAGNKIKRFVGLIKKYPGTLFSCLVDNLESASNIAAAARENELNISVYIDLNTGMNRTGYKFSESLPEFYKAVDAVKELSLHGLHIYDGHLHNLDPELRSRPAKLVLEEILKDTEKIKNSGMQAPRIVAGGSNTFSFYALRPEVESSPGTFVFWDINYYRNLPELDFKFAALLVTTVISKPTADTLCLDLGYKSVSSENPIDKRIIFPWDADLSAQAHSEEHLIVKNTGNRLYSIGDVIYGVPYHICPSCALYDEAAVVEDRQIKTEWKVLARSRKISI